MSDTRETYICDAGESDENNNREHAGDKGSTDRDVNNEGDGNDDGECQWKNTSGSGERNSHKNGNNNSANCLNRNQNVELLPCLVCQTAFKYKIELIKHLTKIHRLTNMCQICYFDEGEIRRFANPVSLRNHKVRDHPEDMVRCVCGAMLIDNKMLSSHLKKFKCNLYNTGNEAKDMAKCICGKRFATQEMLLNHQSKCRKRHCPDDTLLKYISSAVKKKKSCLKTSVIDNVASTETTPLKIKDDSVPLSRETDIRFPREKPDTKPLSGRFDTRPLRGNMVTRSLRGIVDNKVDINNNMSISEDCDALFGRISKVRKCKENILTYSETLYDKYFERAVNSSRFSELSKTSRSKSNIELEFAGRYGTRTSSTHRFSESMPTSNNEVLDLRTKLCIDRNINTVTGNVNNSSDLPGLNNHSSETSNVLSKLETNIDNENAGKVHYKVNLNTINALGIRDLRTHVRSATKQDSVEDIPAIEAQSKTRSSDGPISRVIGTQSKMDSKRRKTIVKPRLGSKRSENGNRRNRATATTEGTYPCKTCRRRYKRPYLYTHRRIAHAQKQWRLVPTTLLKEKSGK